jgi:hypothetical protein
MKKSNSTDSSNACKPLLPAVIFVVTSGDYSDYKIDGIFTEKNTAKDFINMFNHTYNEMRIEEHLLNPKKYEIDNNYNCYFVRMKKDGECTGINIKDNSYDVFEDNHGFDIKNNMYKTVFAKDEKHAIKIVNDVRTQVLASNKWV